jgi:hypothetical protein
VPAVTSAVRQPAAAGRYDITAAVDFTPTGGPLSIPAFDAQAAGANLSDVSQTYSTNAANTVSETGGTSLGNLETTASFLDSSLITKFVASSAGALYMCSRLSPSGGAVGVFFTGGAGELFDSHQGWVSLGGITTNLTAGTTYYAKLDTKTVSPTTTNVTITFLTTTATVVSTQTYADTIGATQGLRAPDTVQISPNGIGVSQIMAYHGVQPNSVVLQGSPSPSPTPSLGPSPTPAPSSSPAPTPTPSRTPSPTPTPTVAPSATPTAVGGSIPEGLYESCGMQWVPTQCLGDLDTFASNGFTRVINYCELCATATEFQQYLTHAASDHIGVVIALNSLYQYGGSGEPSIQSVYPALAATCPSPCTTAPEFAAYVVGLADSNPGTWGYYIGDETTPNAQNEQATAAIYNAIKAVDSKHPTLFVGSMGFATSLQTLTQQLQPFAPYSDYLGDDHYPIGAGDLTGQTQLPVAQAMHELATQDGKPSVLVLQAFGYYEYGYQYCTPYPACAAFPTEQQMQNLYQYSVQGDPNVSMIFWYSYMDIQRSTNPSGNFANLVRAIYNK